MGGHDYPDDALVMYTDAGTTLQRITEESIRLWGLNTRHYVTTCGLNGAMSGCRCWQRGSA